MIGEDYTLQQVETAHLLAVVALAPTRRKAAQMLGINNVTLYRKLKRLNLCTSAQSADNNALPTEQPKTKHDNHGTRE